MYLLYFNTVHIIQEKERARDLEQASSFCENLCNDFVSIASSSESAGQPTVVYFYSAEVRKKSKNTRDSVMRSVR
jgi:hypothetical protein